MVKQSGPLLREQLRLSMLLHGQKRGEPVDPRRPISAPGCLVDTVPDWRTTVLHPAFSRPAGAEREPPSAA